MVPRSLRLPPGLATTPETRAPEGRSSTLAPAPTPCQQPPSFSLLCPSNCRRRRRSADGGGGNSDGGSADSSRARVSTVDPEPERVDRPSPADPRPHDPNRGLLSRVCGPCRARGGEGAGAGLGARTPRPPPRFARLVAPPGPSPSQSHLQP